MLKIKYKIMLKIKNTKFKAFKKKESNLNEYESIINSIKSTKA